MIWPQDTSGCITSYRVLEAKTRRSARQEMKNRMCYLRDDDSDNIFWMKKRRPLHDVLIVHCCPLPQLVGLTMWYHYKILNISTCNYEIYSDQLTIQFFIATTQKLLA